MLEGVACYRSPRTSQGGGHRAHPHADVSELPARFLMRSRLVYGELVIASRLLRWSDHHCRGAGFLQTSDECLVS
jgi:hypothetical protein